MAASDPDDKPETDPMAELGAEANRLALRIGGYVIAGGVIALVYLLILGIPGLPYAGWVAVAWAAAASAAIALRTRDSYWVIVVVAVFVLINAAPRRLFPEAHLRGTPFVTDPENGGWVIGAMAAGCAGWYAGSLQDRWLRWRSGRRGG